MTVGSSVEGLSYIIKTEIKSVALGTRHTISIKFENRCLHYVTIYVKKDYISFYYNCIWDIASLIRNVSRKNKYPYEKMINLICCDIYNLSTFLSSNYTGKSKAEVELAFNIAKEKQKMYRYLNLDRG